MKNKVFAKSVFFAQSAFLVLLLLFLTTFSNAQTTTTFAQFTQRTGGQDFVFTNNLTNATFQTVSGGSAVSFTYLNVVGLPPELQGPQNARVVVTASTTTFAATSGGNRTIQPFNQTFRIEIIRETPFAGRTNLLTAVVTPIGSSLPELSGDEGSFSAAFTASTPVQNVTFTSEFISFTGSTSRNLGLAFSSVNPIYSLGFNFVNSFNAAGTGTFATNQAPVFLIPSAATVSVSGRVLTPKGAALANARVTLTNAAGETLVTWTDASGYYQFSDIIAGETVIIDVKSRLYAYPTQVVNLSEETNGLDFVAQYSKSRFR